MPQPLPMTPPHAPPARCDTTQRRAAIAEALALGVPRDYGRLRRLSIVREPAALAFIGIDINDRPQWLAPRAARAFLRMRESAAHVRVDLDIVSAFRSADYQLGIVRGKRERGLTIDEILKVSAAPGYSEHHSGRAIDLTSPGFAALEEEFEKSPAFRWLARHAKRFGFRLSYPRSNKHGIAYEPWHWCWHAATR